MKRLLSIVMPILCAAAPALASGVIVVEPSNMKADPKAGIVVVDLPAYDAETDPNHTRAPVVGLKDVDETLLGWLRRGTAAGNRGDLYDNRDRDHSNLRADRFPQLTFVEYADDLKKRNIDYGVNPGLIFNRVTIGNSSTASNGPMWRSNARRCYTEGQLAKAMLLQYVSNQIYVYPEHRDHDPGHNGPGQGYGDVFPTNTPYLVISQGSSGSDRAFLEALACTLAAYQPDVKRELTKRRMIAPVTQMILRRTYGDVRTREDYLTGAAHPTVFDGNKLNRRLMIEMAHELDLADVPPLARLRVVEENLGEPGVDYFAPGPAERLMDSPFVVARVHRSAHRTVQMVIEADRFPPAGEGEVKFVWSLLRGDPTRVRITPLKEDGSRVRIAIDYHERMPIAPGSDMASNRVDIACFADNGKLLSAPSFVTVHTLDSERRTYDADGRIVEIEYGAGSTEVDIADWPALARWIKDAAPEDTRWIARAWSEREREAVIAAAVEYVAMVDDAMKHPDNPTRERLLDNAKLALDRDRPVIGGSLRLVLRQGLDLFVLDPKSVESLSRDGIARLRKSAPNAPWTKRLEGLIAGGLIERIDTGGLRVRDGLTDGDVARLVRLNSELAAALTPVGAIKTSHRANYVDPVLAVRRDWRDVYRYAPGVADPIGWTRYRDGAEPQRFTAQGWRVTESDAHGRPRRAVEVSYKREGSAQSSKLVQEDTATEHRFEYDGEADRVGRVAGP